MNWKSLYILLVLSFLVGCAGREIPQSTQTGKIRDIHIGESIDPKELQVRVGDEVRFINGRSAPVQVVFINLFDDQISCQNKFKSSGFSGLFSKEARKINTTTIKANEYASLCFATQGTYGYNARMESTTPGGEMNSMGRIFVD